MFLLLNVHFRIMTSSIPFLTAFFIEQVLSGSMFYANIDVTFFHIHMQWNQLKFTFPLCFRVFSHISPMQLMILVDDVGGLVPAINHSPWNNVTIADFVMPFFLFMVGVSLTLAYKV